MIGTDTQDASDVGCVVTILLVDDDADMRYLARVVMENAGIVVSDEAADGIEALAKLEVLAPPPIPTVILLDNQMPGPSGLEVAEQILAEHPDQIIVLFSAYLDAGIVARAEQLGIAGCVSKGDALDLADIIRDLVAARS